MCQSSGSKTETLCWPQQIAVFASTGEFSPGTPPFSETSSRFLGSQPPDAPTLCGCPIVNLFDDPAYLSDLLQALYDRSFFSDLDASERNVTEVACGILQLAHKYGIETLFKEAVYRIENEYPPAFDEFSQIWGQHKPGAWEAIMLANVAHSISELADLRPRALYLCCQLEFDEILEGALRPDGRRECLSASDIKRCIVGREQLAQANCAALRAVLAAADLVCSCQRPGVCGFRVAAIALERHTMFVSHDALCCVDYIFEKQEDNGLCWLCIQQMKSQHVQERKQIWSNLRLYFCLDEPE